MPDFASATAWDTWIRQRDWDLRGHADQAVEDLISGWIVSGSSFTEQPVLASQRDAVNAAGTLTAVARARIEDFIKGLDTRDDERWRDVLSFVTRLRVTEEELPAYLGGIIRRSALDHATELRRDENPPLLMDFAISEALRALQARGATPAHIRRAAIIGPELDFSGGPGGYDFFPVQTIQPFAVLEALQRLNLARMGEAQLSLIGMNPLVLSHVRTILSKVRSGRYVMQLPLNTSAGWSAEAMSYWSRFGELIGKTGEPATLPPGLHHVNMRAIAVKAQAGARITVNDLDIVAQAMESAPGNGFDLVLALDGLSGYDRMEQSLALASISEMMNPGAILLVDGIAPVKIPPDLEGLGSERVVYSEAGKAIDVTVYRRR